jgi:hypothetical protein
MMIAVALAKIKRHPNLFGFVLIVMLILGIQYYYVQAALDRERSGMVKPASETVFINGKTILAENDTSGSITYSGTDAATVINTAISALTNGGTVFIKAGTYSISSTGSGTMTWSGFGYYGITNGGRSNIQLCGEGPSTVLQLSSSAPENMTLIYFSGTGLTGFTIHDMKLDGNRANRPYSTATNENGVYISGSGFDSNSISKVLIYDLQIVNFWTYGIAGNYLTDFKVTSSIFYNNAADALNTWKTVDTVFADNSVSSSSDVGLDVSNCTGVLLDGNQVSQMNLGASPFGANYGQAFAIEGSSASKYVTLSNDYATTTKNAVAIDNAATNLQILNCQFVSSSSYAIIGSSAPAAVQIENTYIQNSGANAIIFNGLTYSTIRGNTFNTIASGFAAIWLDDYGSTASAYNLIEGNSINGLSYPWQGAIMLTGSSTGARYNTIQENEINAGGNSSPGIYLDTKTSYNYVADNDLRPGGAPGITDKGVSNIIENNPGYNPVGAISTPFNNSTALILDNGATGSTPANITTLTVAQSPKLIMVTIGTWTAGHTLVIKIDSVQIVSVSMPSAGTVYTFRLEPGETFYIQYNTGHTSFYISGQ